MLIINTSSEWLPMSAVSPTITGMTQRPSACAVQSSTNQRDGETPVAEFFVFAALPVQTARLFNPRPSFLRYDSSLRLSLNEQSLLWF